MRRWLKKFSLDLEPARESRDFRLLTIGQVISALGAQAVLVALPYQIFVISHSPTLVGLLGLFELGPMIVVSLVGGAIADRRDRRPVLAVAQIGVIAVTAILFVISLSGNPPVIALLLLGGVLAGCTALDGVARGSILPGVLGPDLLRSGLALNYGFYQAAAIVGPGIGGLVIAATGGVKSVYAIDALTSVAMLLFALAIAPQPPIGVTDHPPVLKSITEGLKFVGSNKALAGSFVIDINAMMFGMPRALFAVLALTVYHAGSEGTGLLYAAIAFGGTVSVLTSRWVQDVNRLGRVVIICVLLWGLAILGTGFVRTIGPAAILLAVAGWADGISAICRSTISQTVTPDRLRGRMSSVFSLVVTSGPRLGDIESGVAAGIAGAVNSVMIGGVACILGVGATVVAFPELAAYDANDAMARVRAENLQAEGATT
jgi:MFS family permease